MVIWNIWSPLKWSEHLGSCNFRGTFEGSWKVGKRWELQRYLEHTMDRIDFFKKLDCLWALHRFDNNFTDDLRRNFEMVGLLTVAKFDDLLLSSDFNEIILNCKTKETDMQLPLTQAKLERKSLNVIVMKVFTDYWLSKRAIPDVHYSNCKTNTAKFGYLIIFESNY